MALDQALVDAAIEQLEARLPGLAWAGAAAMRLDDGQVLTSTAPKAFNPATELCHETGALCEAYRLGRSVLASVCVTRAPGPESGFLILAPCGVCQERLMIYGPDVEVAVPRPADPARWRALRLAELQPYWWGRVVPGSAWPYE